MKFLTFTDLHQDMKVLKELLARAKKPDIEFVVCAGDTSVFGAGLSTVFKKFNDLGKKFYFIPGNHEEGLDYGKVMAKHPNCVDLHLKAIEIEGYVFLGYGGGGFNQKDPEFRKISREWYSKYNGKKIVLVTHGPPQGTTSDKIDDVHVGNIDFRKFIERAKPKLMICGHLHETAGAIDEVNGTKVINPGWDGMVIELN